LGEIFEEGRSAIPLNSTSTPFERGL
jgi:hypothetical protein